MRTGLLPRRLPDRPGALGGRAARLPRVPDAVRMTRHGRTRCSATRASRSATPSTRTTWSSAFRRFFRRPRVGEVYNIGGGRIRNCSMLEAIELCAGDHRAASSTDTYEDDNRIGDHIWWIGDTRTLRGALPRLEADLRRAGDPAGDLRGQRRHAGQAAHDRPTASATCSASTSTPSTTTAPSIALLRGALGPAAPRGDRAGRARRDDRRARSRSTPGSTASTSSPRTASRCAGRSTCCTAPRLPDRVYGPELTLRVLRRGRRAGLPVYFYGSRPEVLRALGAERLTNASPA